MNRWQIRFDKRKDYLVGYVRYSLAQEGEGTDAMSLSDNDDLSFCVDACPDCGSSDALGVYVTIPIASRALNTRKSAIRYKVMRQQQPLYRTKIKQSAKAYCRAKHKRYQPED